MRRFVRFVKGLSPRVRGNRLTISTDSATARSIPACAGEPVITSPPYNLRKVYPRVCGGTHFFCMEEGASSGLSPRVRGNRGVHMDEEGVYEVYPRVCGGTVDNV